MAVKERARFHQNMIAIRLCACGAFRAGYESGFIPRSSLIVGVFLESLWMATREV